MRAALEPAYREDTRDTLRFAWLAFARAALGDHDGAVAVARNLYKNVSAGGNLIEAPGVEEILARVLVRMGKLDEAAAILETLLTKPYIGMLNASHPLTRASLRLDPEWNRCAGRNVSASCSPARKFPRFLNDRAMSAAIHRAPSHPARPPSPALPRVGRLVTMAP